MPTHQPEFTKCPFCHGDVNAFIGGNDICECHGTGLLELEPGVGARRLAIDADRGISGITYAPIAKVPDPTRTKRAKEHLARLAKSKGKRLLVDLDASGREALDALLMNGYGKSQREVVIKSLCATHKALSAPLT